ncbi:riboflavin kinase/FAD synthetase [Spiroplasma sabaudiense Ar-1343]|uniref:riboflavin kinase n=1 Tax=Spiroplasma sabaudiense Ar-1343 TaxID=1276257 RepID=W6A9Q4_9MOLU|nr:riboflavin kinase [Spiroplasma sabaudiense]AHI53903.1 riboflavin kinase/FAD synthetase [Spiroplasma sabaudiense Ar-1343]
MQTVIYYNPLARMLYNLEPNLVLISDLGNWTNNHNQQIDKLYEEGKKRNLKTAVVIFKKDYIESNRLWNEKNLVEKFHQSKVDYLIIYYYNKLFFNSEAQQWLDEFNLMKINLNTKGCLYDESFTLFDKGLIKPHWVSCFEQESLILPKVINEEKNDLLKLLKTNQFDKFFEKTGVNYTFEEFILTGKQLGRKIGFPTANQKIDKKLPLIEGVYLTEIEVRTLEPKKFYGLSDYWTNNEGESLFETFILDFDLEIYGWLVRVKPIKYLRANQKISSLEELKILLEKDLKNANKIIATIDQKKNSEL